MQHRVLLLAAEGYIIEHKCLMRTYSQLPFCGNNQLQLPAAVDTSELGLLARLLCLCNLQQN